MWVDLSGALAAADGREEAPCRPRPVTRLADGAAADVGDDGEHAEWGRDDGFKVAFL